MWLAEVAASDGDFAAARRIGEEARARASAIGWRRGVVSTQWILADVCFEQGDDRLARGLAEESVTGTRDQIVAPWWLVLALLSLGQIAVAQRDFACAEAALSEGTRLAREIGDRSGVATGLQAFACLAFARGRLQRAACLLAAAESMRRSLGGTIRLVSRRMQRQLEPVAEILEPQAYQTAHAKGQGMSLEEAVDYALSAGAGADQSGEGSAGPPDVLTPREREVAGLVAEGLTNRQIAGRLVLTEKTAANHVARIFDKLGVHSRGQLAARAVELGLRKPSR